MDDDAQVRHSLARVIEAHGLSTIEASSGAEALAILERDGEVPLVISDIYMPEMDGVTFIREALRRFPDMAIVMLTGVAEVATAVECLKLGALDYISKPVLIEEVRARVDKALEKRDLVLQNRFYQQHLESRVRELDRRNRQSLINGVQMLVHALEAKDAYTSGHSTRVARYAVKTAVQLGYTGDRLEQHPARRRAARHRQDRHPGGHPEQAGTPHVGGVPARSRSTPRWASGSWRRFCPSRPACSASSGRITNGWTATAFPTGSRATRSRTRPASSRWSMPSTP